VSDRELLRHYVVNHDEEAFAGLVRRHASMVWGVCRRLLDNEQDVGDAFQAFFLVLFRKSASLRVGPSLANWLHAVATRIAWKSRWGQALCAGSTDYRLIIPLDIFLSPRRELVSCIPFGNSKITHVAAGRRTAAKAGQAHRGSQFVGRFPERSI
jgi:hypothetical protein